LHNHWAQQGAWAGVTNLVAMTSNAPPDVDPKAVAGSGRQGLQVLVFWVLARRSRVVHADTGGFSRLTASSSSVAATVAPSMRIAPATAAARARVWGSGPS
jgi:hypothetical protein